MASKTDGDWTPPPAPAAPPRAAAPPRQRRVIRPTFYRPFTWRAAVIIAMLCFWEGFPFALFGMPMIFGYQLYAALCFAGVGLYLVRLMRGFERPGIWEALPLLLFVWCIIVSANYSMWLRPQVLEAWLPAVFSVGPVLTIFLLLGIGATRNDAEQALYWGAMVASIFVIIDWTLKLNLLAIYGRGSAFNTSKVVFFKLTSMFAIMVAMMRLFEWQPRRVLLDAFALFVMSYNVFILTESRLAILGVFLAMVPIWFFVLRGGRKVAVGALVPILFLPVAVYLVTLYIPDIRSLDSYMRQDISATYRLAEADFYYRQFMETGGMGFGFMSGDPRFDNLLTFAATQASQLYGDKYRGVPVNLVDIGIQSALYQYGWVGLILIITMTATAVITLVRSRSMGLEYMTSAALGWLMLSLMISPVSMNYFTIFYTAHMGGLLWFIASRVSAERRGVARDR